MEQDRISLVRQRAHAIWIAQGKPEGLAAEHWAQAEQEFAAAEAAATITPVSAAEPKATAPAKKTARRKVTPATAPDVGAPPHFETPAEPPVAPDVISITEPAVAPAAKAPRRKKPAPKG